MKRSAQAVILVLVLTMVGGVWAAVSVQGKVEIVFTPQERQIIREYYSKEIIEQAGGAKGKGKKGLPPGLAKREKLPPGIQKQLRRNGTLPPGLEKKMEPLPKEVEVRMKQLPPECTRVVIGTDVIILDKTTQKILDIIHDVAILARDIAR
jgi:hypothetical protein